MRRYFAIDMDCADISTLVLCAVEHLQDLGQRISELQIEGNSLQEISEIIQLVINALHEIDSGRLKLHEDLEAETIKASIHRHKISTFAEEIEAEIRGAVAAARNSNESEVEHLQGKIAEILSETERLENEYKLLYVESCSLEPSKDKGELEHDKIVAYLNQALTDRANCQLKLNETRDHLRETYYKTNDIENALVEIEIEVKEDHEEAMISKKKLEKSDIETKKKIQAQAALNLVKSKELKDVQGELQEKEIELDNEKKVIREIDALKIRLEATQMQLSKQIRNEVKENAILTQEGMKILELGAESSQKLMESQKQLKETKLAIESEMEKSAMEYKQLHSEKSQLSNELETAKQLGAKEKDVADMMQKQLKDAKNDMSLQAEECSRLKRMNSELDSQIEQLAQDHQAVVELLHKQISDFTFNLSLERQERQLLQSKRDEVTKETNEFKFEYGKLMTGVTKRINDGKTEHQKLTNLGVLLQKNLKQFEADIINKQRELKREKENLADVQQSCESKVSQLEITIATLEKEISEKMKLLEEKLPEFLELEQSFKQKESDFEEMKKYIVDLKNKKSEIEASISTTKQKISTMQNPQTFIQQQISENRRKNLEELKQQANALKKKEKAIIFNERRLDLLKVENAKMLKGIKHMQLESEHMSKQTESFKCGTVISDEHIKIYKGWLDHKWQEDLKLEKEYSDRDIPYIEELMGIQAAAITREARVDEVHNKLEEQLRILADFVDSVATLRQKK